MAIMGILLIVFGLFLLVFKLHVSYTSHGGALGGVPVLDGALFPPLAITFGLVFLKPIGINMGSGWWYFLFWLGLTVLAAWALCAVGELGEKHDV